MDELRLSLFDACHILLTITTAIFTFTGNILMIVVIVRTDRLHQPQGSMLLSIAAADLVLGLEALLGFLNVIMSYRPDDQRLCVAMGYVTSVVITTNIFTLAFMSVDRWLLIHKPFVHDTLMPRKRIVLILCLLWVLSITSYTPFLFIGIEYEYYIDIHICVVTGTNALYLVIAKSLSRLPSLCVIIIFTIMTCRTAHIHAQRIHALESSRPRTMALSTNYKHIRTSLIIILTNTLTWLPLYLTELLEVAVASLTAPRELVFIASWLLSSSAYINWLICMITDANFREATSKLFKNVKLCKCNHRTQYERSAGQRASNAGSHGSVESEELRF